MYTFKYIIVLEIKGKHNFHLFFYIYTYCKNTYQQDS